MNDLEYIVPGVVAIVLLLTAGGVVLLRPLSKRLGELMEAMIAEKREERPGLEEHLSRIRDLLETQNDRLTLLEERVEFTERLIERRGDSQPPRGQEGPPNA